MKLVWNKITPQKNEKIFSLQINGAVWLRPTLPRVLSSHYSRKYKTEGGNMKCFCLAPSWLVHFGFSDEVPQVVWLLKLLMQNIYPLSVCLVFKQSQTQLGLRRSLLRSAVFIHGCTKVLVWVCGSRKSPSYDYWCSTHTHHTHTTFKQRIETLFTSGNSDNPDR